MYINEKMMSVETVPGIRGKGERGRKRAEESMN
jgi:hypothetical protein